MAKQLVNPIERHVEKVVLGLAGLVLIAVIARYLVTSPNPVEIAGESATPSTIYQKVAQQAVSTRDRIRRASADVQMPETLYEDWEEYLNPFDGPQLSLTLPVAVGIGPDVPIIDPPEPVVGQKDLVEVVPAGKPVFTTGRTTFLLEEEGSNTRSEPLNWVTVSVVFNVKEQMAAQSREYGAARKDVLFGPVELQRRTRREDGNWFDEDWEFVGPWPGGKVPPVPNIPLVQEGTRVVVPREDRANVDQFFERLRQPSLQLAMIRPMMPEWVNGDRWMFPIITKERDVLVQDDYYLRRNEPPATDPVSRYAPADDEAIVGAGQPPPDELLAKAEELLKAAYKNNSQDQAVEAYNLARTVEDDEELGGSIRRRAAKLGRRALEAENDIKRRLDQGGQRSMSPGEGEKEFRREPVRIQQVWVHDARPGSVESGKTYQYRLRPLIYNRLAGEPDKFRNKADAVKVFIPGEWTEPVEVTIKPDMVFFVSSQDNRNEQIGVEFYKWFEGVWVKSRRFKYSVGERLEDHSRHDVPSWEDHEVTDNVRVSFAADAIVVDIDFERAFRERKRGTTRSGVKFAAPRPACAVVFADPAGRLHQRMVPTDKRHPDKRVFTEMLYKPTRD